MLVSEVLAIISEPGEEIPDRPTMTAPIGKPSQAEAAPTLRETLVSREVRVSPAARALARRHGLNLTEVRGTGRDGRIQTEDVLRVLDRLRTPASEKLGTTPRVGNPSSGRY